MGGPSSRRVRRWAGVIVVLALLGLLPAIARALPAPGRTAESAASLLHRIRASTTAAYDGYAESHATLAVPDVSQLGTLPTLLGETSKLRVWWAASDHWRVDDINDLGESDDYALPDGLWQWESQTERATFTEGQPSVRAPRAADLLPSALGARLAATATSAATRIGSHRVAGRSAQGLRLVPRAPTTVSHVDIWADTATGLPLQVQIYAIGSAVPVLATAFLSVHLAPQSDRTTTFDPPPGSKITFLRAQNFRSVLGRLRDLDAPATVVGLHPLATGQASNGLASYGDALGTLVVLALARDDADRLAGQLDTVGVEDDFPNALAVSVSTPLVNALLVRGRFSTLLITGTVPLDTLRDAYTELGDRRADSGQYGSAFNLPAAA